MNLGQSRLLQRERIASGTLAVRVERPHGFTFHAGQFVELCLVNPPFRDAEGPVRSLSIASAPAEPDLLLVMRERPTAFKRSLAEMPIGAPLLLEGPIDDLSFEVEPGRPLVLVAGGVGIAAFLSLLREAALLRRPLPATLFYSNRRPEDAAFLEELRSMETRVRGFRLVATMTRVAGSGGGWTGETARLGVPLFRKYLSDLVGPAYRIVGAPLLVSELCRDLEEAGVPGPDIRVDLYVGY